MIGGKTVGILLVLAAAHSAYATTFNPFRGGYDATAPTMQKPPAPKAAAISAGLPALPPVAAPAAPLPPPPAHPEKALDKQASERAVVWKVVGRIGDQITLANLLGDRAVVTDGAMKAGCLVAYPDVLCDKAEIAETKKRFAAEARARAEEEATVAVQKTKIAEMQLTISKMRLQMNAAYDETARFRAENALLAKEKAQLVELPELANKQRQQLENSARQIERLRAENIRLAEKVAKEQAKLDEELSAFKQKMVAAPEWVKGSAKEYSDSSLGRYTVRRQGSEVFFIVQNQKEATADTVFGKNVLRKERRGDYTYYALNAKAVRFKE